MKSLTKSSGMCCSFVKIQQLRISATPDRNSWSVVWGWWFQCVKAALGCSLSTLQYDMLQMTSERCPLIPQITWNLLKRAGPIRRWQTGAINRSPKIDIFFGGLSGESHPILSRSAARGQGAGIRLRNSDSAGGGGEGRGGEEMEGREAACQWACPVSLSTTQNSHLENQRLQPSGCLTHSLPPLNKNQADRTWP